MDRVSNGALPLHGQSLPEKQEAPKVAGGNGSEAEKMEARIEADVYESIQRALAYGGQEWTALCLVRALAGIR
jgi:hypothetical protein